MANLLTDIIKKQMTDQLYAQAAQKLGVDSKQSQTLVNQALPTLLNGLAKNSQSANGAANLLSALKAPKHSGQLLGSNEDFFTASNLEEGDKILKHILGDTRDDIVKALGSEANTDPSTAETTLKALAPVVMSGLGKVVQSEKLNADQVSKILQIATKEKDFGKVANHIALLLWDKDKDGQYKDDLFEMGKRMISQWLSRKK